MADRPSAPSVPGTPPKIDVGDLVTVCMTRNDIFPFQTAPRISGAMVTWAPVASGDSWHFMMDGIAFTVNPQSSDFVGLVRHD